MKLGTPNSKTATKLLLLGAGELGKEVAIEAQRLGVEVIAVDRYANAPAMQVAHRSHVISMLDEKALRIDFDYEITLLTVRHVGRMGVVLATAPSIDLARQNVKLAHDSIQVEVT